MHLMNFPPKTIGSEQSTYAEPLIRRVKVSAPRHLSSRNSNKLPSEDNVSIFTLLINCKFSIKWPQIVDNNYR